MWVTFRAAFLGHVVAIDRGLEIDRAKKTTPIHVGCGASPYPVIHLGKGINYF